MGASNTESSGSKISYFALKAKTSETDGTPYFGKSEKRGEKWEITEKFNTMSGNLSDIEQKEYEYEGQMKKKLVLKFYDIDGSDIVEMNFNNLTYSILNSLASLESFDLINITVVLGKANDKGKRFPNAYLKQGDVDVKWKYQPAELPRPTKTKVPIPNTTQTVEVTVDQHVFQFWEDVINKIKTKLRIKEISGEVHKEIEQNPIGDSLPF